MEGVLAQAATEMNPENTAEWKKARPERINPVVKSLNHVQLFTTPLTTAHQASLSITNSRSLLKVTSIESVMPSNHLILRRPLFLPPSIFPRIRVFSYESSSHHCGQNIGVSASASVLPMNIQDRFLLGWTGWISSQSKGLSRVFDVGSHIRHYWQNGGMVLTPSPHPTGTVLGWRS